MAVAFRDLPRPTCSRTRLLRVVRELSSFGLVGVVAFVVDVGGFNLLRFAGGEGPLYQRPIAAKVISAAAATVVSWLGNRYVTFRQRRRSEAHREFLLFVVMCAIGVLPSLVCLATTHYLLGLRSALADNVSANLVGLGIGTAFRFWAYRTHVFNEHRRRAPGRSGIGSGRQPERVLGRS
jgi:putative flippase GtrA